MATNKYPNPTNYVQQLIDQPNDMGGMTAQSIKTQFDRGLTEFVSWWNDNGASIIDLQNLLIGQFGTNFVGQAMLTNDLFCNIENGKLFSYKNIGGAL